MSKPDDWYPHYIADYAADTMHLTTLQHGAYRLLMDAYWRNQGPLDNDDEALASTVKLPLKDWRKMRPTIARFFQIDFCASTWSHKRIEKELAKAKHNTEQKSKAGKASAEAKRQQKDNGNVNGASTAVGTEPTTEPQLEGQQKPNSQSTPHTSPLPDAASAASFGAAPERRLAERAAGLAGELKAICGTDENRHPAWGRLDAIAGWLEAGADPDLDVLPTARAVMARRGDRGPPSSPSYLTEAVLESLSKRRGIVAAAPPVTAPDPEREEAAKRLNQAMDEWVAKGREGPMPALADYLPGGRLHIPDMEPIPAYLTRKSA